MSALLGAGMLGGLATLLLAVPFTMLLCSWAWKGKSCAYCRVRQSELIVERSRRETRPALDGPRPRPRPYPSAVGGEASFSERLPAAVRHELEAGEQLPIRHDTKHLTSAAPCHLARTFDETQPTLPESSAGGCVRLPGAAIATSHTVSPLDLESLG